MRRSRLLVSLVLLSGMAIAETSAVEAQDRQSDASAQTQQPDGRYLIYMRGIT